MSKNQPIDDRYLWMLRNISLPHIARMCGRRCPNSLSEELRARGWYRDTQGRLTRAPCKECGTSTGVAELGWYRICDGCAAAAQEANYRKEWAASRGRRDQRLQSIRERAKAAQAERERRRRAEAHDRRLRALEDIQQWVDEANGRPARNTPSSNGANPADHARDGYSDTDWDDLGNLSREGTPGIVSGEMHPPEPGDGNDEV